MKVRLVTMLWSTNGIEPKKRRLQLIIIVVSCLVIMTCTAIATIIWKHSNITAINSYSSHDFGDNYDYYNGDYDDNGNITGGNNTFSSPAKWNSSDDFRDGYYVDDNNNTVSFPAAWNSSDDFGDEYDFFNYHGEYSITCSNYDNQQLSFSQWLHQSGRDSRRLCDPEFLPSSTANTIDATKPVQVFIMMGQSNMIGMGKVENQTDPRSLRHVVAVDKRYTHLITETPDTNNSTGNWSAPRSDVRYVYVDTAGGESQVISNDWLAVPEVRFGVELQFGHVMGEIMREDPVLLLKSCIGNRALGWDLLPPGSPTYNGSDGYTYPAYGEAPERWLTNSTASIVNDSGLGWYAGIQYDMDVKNAKQVLSDLNSAYPGASSYEIAGFLWWQGFRDTEFSGHAENYEANMVRFIDSVRQDFDAPDAKFVIATVGHGGVDPMERQEVFSGQPYLDLVWEAQMDMNNYTRYPDFQGNVMAVDMRPSWRSSEDGQGDTAHYFYDANVFMEAGNSLAWGMANLLFGDEVDEEAKGPGGL